MTMLTRVRTTSEGLDALEVFNYCRNLIGAGRSYKAELNVTEQRRSDGVTTHQMEIGQGLPALLSVEFVVGGKLPEDDGDYGKWKNLRAPDAWIEVLFDTTYSYRGNRGATCGDLHAYLVGELGAYFDSHAVTWEWYDESGTGWAHTRYGVADLGSPARGALANLPVSRP